jgi:predicted enzyme related to lactoylglutathione lyase
MTASAHSSPVVHLELHTADLAQARTFCATLCGWRGEPIDTVNGSYLAFELSNNLGGGIVQCSSQDAIWLPYVQVAQIDAATYRAQQLGASVLLEPREGPAGWRSVITTPEAGQIALWQQKGWRS